VAIKSFAFCHSYESPFWLTFRQALQAGGNVRRARNRVRRFWKQHHRGKGIREPQKIPLLRYYSVFNVAQCDGLKIATAPVETTHD